MRRWLIAGVIFLAGCDVAPDHLSLYRYDYKSVIVQCEDEHEPVLIVNTHNRTKGVVACEEIK